MSPTPGIGNPSDYQQHKLTSPIPCCGAKGTDKEGVLGYLYGTVEIEGRWWAVVKWGEDGSLGQMEDPDLYKANCLCVERKTWVPLSVPPSTPPIRAMPEMIER